MGSSFLTTLIPNWSCSTRAILNLIRWKRAKYCNSSESCFSIFVYLPTPTSSLYQARLFCLWNGTVQLQQKLLSQQEKGHFLLQPGKDKHQSWRQKVKSTQPWRPFGHIRKGDNFLAANPKSWKTFSCICSYVPQWTENMTTIVIVNAIGNVSQQCEVLTDQAGSTW